MLDMVFEHVWFVPNYTLKANPSLHFIFEHLSKVGQVARDW